MSLVRPVALAIPVAAAALAHAAGGAWWAGLIGGLLVGALVYERRPAPMRTEVPPPRPVGAPTTDAGLAALAEGRPDEARGHWGALVTAKTADPEPYLFLSLLHRRVKAWDRFDVAVALARRACELDPGWPDAWLAVGEWHVVRALVEGQRRTQGTSRRFRLDDMLREQGAWDVALSAYARAAELDGGRLRAEIVALSAKLHGEDPRLRIFERAGDGAGVATARSAPALLRRAGVPASAVGPNRRPEEILAEAEREGRALVLVPGEGRIQAWETLLREQGRPCVAVRGFRDEADRARWLGGVLECGLGLLSPWAATWPWEDSGRVRVLWMDAQDLSLLQLLGSLAGGPAERSWTFARLCLEKG